MLFLWWNCLHLLSHSKIGPFTESLLEEGVLKALLLFQKDSLKIGLKSYCTIYLKHYFYADLLSDCLKVENLLPNLKLEKPCLECEEV